jgi:Ricin-type beta-trefoil lectin domain-like
MGGTLQVSSQGAITMFLRTRMLFAAGVVGAVLISTAGTASAAGPNDVSAIPIRNGFSTKCLETNNDVGYNGAKVQQWSCVGQSAALWDLEFVRYENFDFVYYIHHHDHPGKCLEIPDWSHDNGARAQLWDCVGQSSALWRKHIYGDTFILVNVSSGKCLEMPDWSTADGAIAQQWDCVGQSSAEWYHYA